MEAIIIFFGILFIYMCLAYMVNNWSKLFFLKNSLAIINTIGALSFLMFYILHFGNIFKPVSQTLFGWPALVGFILLGFASYSGLKGKFHYYSKKMKFWKKSFWERQLNKSPYRLVAKFLPKIGLILFVTGVAVKIMQSCIIPAYRTLAITALYQLLILAGISVFIIASLTILKAVILYISKEKNDSKTEDKKGMVSALNNMTDDTDPHQGLNYFLMS